MSFFLNRMYKINKYHSFTFLFIFSCIFSRPIDQQSIHYSVRTFGINFSNISNVKLPNEETQLIFSFPKKIRLTKEYETFLDSKLKEIKKDKSIKIKRKIKSDRIIFNINNVNNADTIFNTFLKNYKEHIFEIDKNFTIGEILNFTLSRKDKDKDPTTLYEWTINIEDYSLQVVGGRVLSSMPIGEVFNVANLKFSDSESNAIINNENTLKLDLDNSSIPIWYNNEKEDGNVTEFLSIKNTSIQKNKSVSLFSKLLDNNESTITFHKPTLSTDFWESKLEIIGSITISKIDASIITPAISIPNQSFNSYSNISINLGTVVNLKANDIIKVILDDKLSNVIFFHQDKSIVDKIASYFIHDNGRYSFVSENEIHFILRPEDIKAENQIILDNIPVSVGGNANNAAMSCKIVLPLETSIELIIDNFLINSNVKKLSIQIPPDNSPLDIPIDGFICIDYENNSLASNKLIYSSKYGQEGGIIKSEHCLEVGNKVQLISEKFNVNENFNLIKYNSEVYQPDDQSQIFNITLIDVKLKELEHRTYTGNTTNHTIPVSIIDTTDALTTGDLLRITLPPDSKIKFIHSENKTLEIPIEKGIKNYTYDIFIEKNTIGSESINYTIETDYWSKEHPVLLRYGAITLSSEGGAIIYNREKNRLPKIVFSGIDILSPDDNIYLSLFDSQSNKIQLIGADSNMIDSIKVSDLKNNQIVDLFSEGIEDTSIKILNLEVDVSISSGKKERVNTVESILKDIGFRVEFNNPQMSNYWISNDNMGDSLDVYLKSNKDIMPYIEDFYLSISLPPKSGMQWGSMVDNSIDNYFSKIQQDNSTLKISVPIIDLMNDLAVDTLVHIGSIPIIEKETDLRKDFQINYTINEENINKEYKSNEKYFSYYSPEISIVKSTKGKFNKKRADIYLPRQESLKIQIKKLLISESLPKLIEPNNKIILWFEDSEWYWINDDFSNYETNFFKIHEIPSEEKKLEQLILSIPSEISAGYSVEETISNLSAVYNGSTENLKSNHQNLFMSIDKGNGFVHKLNFSEKLAFSNYDIKIDKPTNIIWSSDEYKISGLNLSSELINSDELINLKLLKKTEGGELIPADWDENIVTFLQKNNIVGLTNPTLETLSILSFEVDPRRDSLKFISLRSLPINRTSERNCEVFLTISFDGGKNYIDNFHVGNIITPSEFRLTDAGVNQLLSLPSEQKIGAIEIVENLQDVTLKEGNFLILTHTSDIDILSENHRDIIITGSGANKIEFIKIENIDNAIVHKFLIKDDFDLGENIIFNGITFKTKFNRSEGKITLSYTIKDKNSTTKTKPIETLGEFRIHPFILSSKIDTIYTLTESQSSFNLENIIFEQKEGDLSIYKGDTLMLHSIQPNSEISFSKNQLLNESFELIWSVDTLRYIYNGNSNIFNFNLSIDRPHNNSPQNFIELGGLITFKYKRNEDGSIIHDVFGNEKNSIQRTPFNSGIRFAFSNGVPSYSMIDSLDFLINWGKQKFPDIIMTEDSLMQTMSVGTKISISIPKDINAEFSREPDFDKRDYVRNVFLSDSRREVNFEIRRSLNINESIEISNLTLDKIDYPLTSGYTLLDMQIIKTDTSINIASDHKTGRFRIGDVSIYLHENAYITKDKQMIDYIGIEYNQILDISNFLDFSSGNNINSIGIKLDRLPNQRNNDGKFSDITSSLWSERDDAEVKIDDIKDGGNLLLFHMNTDFTNEIDFSVRDIYFREVPARENATEYKLSLIRQLNGNVLSSTNESILVDYNMQSEKICDIINKITIGFSGGEREILKSNILSIKQDNTSADLEITEFKNNEFRLVDSKGFDKSSSYKIKFKLELNENVDKVLKIQPSVYVNDCGGQPLKELSDKFIKYDGEGFLPSPKRTGSSNQNSRNIKSLTIPRKNYTPNNNSLEFDLSLDFNSFDCSKAGKNYVDLYNKLWNQINLRSSGLESISDAESWEIKFNRMIIELDKTNNCGNFTNSSVEINYLRSLAYLLNNQINECEDSYSKAKSGGIEDSKLQNGLKFEKIKECSGLNPDFADGLIEDFIEIMEENQKVTNTYIRFKEKDKKVYYKFNKSSLNNYLDADSILNKIYAFDNIAKKLKNNCEFCKADLDLGLVFSDFNKIESYTNKKSKSSYKKGRFTPKMCKKIKGGNKYKEWREDRRNKYEYLYSLREDSRKDLQSYENPKRIRKKPIKVKIKDSVKSDNFSYPIISSRNNLNVDGTRIRDLESDIYLPTTGIYRLESPSEEDGKHLKFFGVLSFSLLAIMIGSSY